MLENLVKVGRRYLILHRLKYGVRRSSYLATIVSGFHGVHCTSTLTRARSCQISFSILLTGWFLVFMAFAQLNSLLSMKCQLGGIF